jgi:hypothetical protein
MTTAPAPSDKLLARANATAELLAAKVFVPGEGYVDRTDAGAQAKSRAGKIRREFAAMTASSETIHRLVTEAWQAGDWQALGYPDWEHYVMGEFGTATLKLDRAVRQAWVRSLTDAGLSTREIAPVVNASHMTVERDIRPEDDHAVTNVTERSSSQPVASRSETCPDCGGWSGHYETCRTAFPNDYGSEARRAARPEPTEPTEPDPWANIPKGSRPFVERSPLMAGEAREPDDDDRIIRRNGPDHVNQPGRIPSRRLSVWYNAILNLDAGVGAATETLRGAGPPPLDMTATDRDRFVADLKTARGRISRTIKYLEDVGTGEAA